MPAAPRVTSTAPTTVTVARGRRRTDVDVVVCHVFVDEAKTGRTHKRNAFKP
jgi:hypothetical protein